MKPKLFMTADGSLEIYGSKRAAVVPMAPLPPGTPLSFLEDGTKNWRVCGLDATGERETWSVNIFRTKEEAIGAAEEGGFDFEVFESPKHFKELWEE